MLKYLSEYPSIFEENLNMDLLNRTFDRPIVEFVKECFLSLQILKSIEILGFEYTEKASEININKYIYKRNKGKKRKEIFDYKMIDDTICGLLTMKVRITVESSDPKTGETDVQTKTINKGLLIPLEDENGNYFIKGELVYIIYQLVEKSTYTAVNSVILKSLMPFFVNRQTIVKEDIRGTEYVIPYYNIKVFSSYVEIMLLFATRGLNYAIQFSLDTPYLVIQLVTTPDHEDLSHLYFQVSNTIFIKVDKELFINYSYVQSIVGGILAISTNRLTMDKVDDPEIWIKRLGGGNLKKGYNLLESTKRLLDKTTGKVLKLNIYNKHDVLSLCRWMMEEYNDLRMKDNVDINNKRVRRNEIFECLLTYDISLKLNRIMTLGSKATMENYMELFSFPGDLIIQLINSSGICRYNDIVNDMDFFSKFKWTTKGPQSLNITL